jgi:hypothetical protein
MPSAFYSAVIPAPIDGVWTVARDFGNYRLFTSGRGDVIMEEGKAGDCVGAVRAAVLDGGMIRQRLLAHSDEDRCYTYEFCSAPPLPMKNYVATLRFRPIVEIEQTLVEWCARFDCDLAAGDGIRERLEKMFAAWIASLRQAVIAGD